MRSCYHGAPRVAYAVPSLLSPLTSFALTSLPLGPPPYTFPRSEALLALQQKLHLPILSHTGFCACGQLMDVMGDHCFACTLLNKAVLHNRTRDSLFCVTSTIAVLAKLTPSPFGVSRTNWRWCHTLRTLFAPG